MNEITNLNKNRMGTLAFNGKFGTMRKAENWVVYPITESTEHNTISIQSNSRWAEIRISDGIMLMSASHSFSNRLTLQMDLHNNKAQRIVLDATLKDSLFNAIRATASPMAGNNCLSMFCDNSGASQI